MDMNGKTVVNSWTGGSECTTAKVWMCSVDRHSKFCKDCCWPQLVTFMNWWSSVRHGWKKNLGF